MTTNELISKYRADFENACDDLYYGYGFSFWSKTCSIEDTRDQKRVWIAAINKMSKD